LGFLDFSTLDRRRFYCEEEVRLNRLWAPDLYLGVVPITRCEAQAKIGGKGTAVEYAVKMRRFDPAMCLDVQLADGKLSIADMRELAEMLGKRHEAAPTITAELRTQTVSRAIELIRENFPPLENVIERRLYDELYLWTMRQLDELAPVLWRRFDDGWFRQCHGDLHLRNIVRLPGGITTFDCIEFSTDLRNTDVMADIAFLVMDLVAKQQLGLAAHCINRYLEVTGDYPGMHVFNLYFVYRCLVRAKVAVIRGNERTDPGDRQKDLEKAHGYCEMARHQANPGVPLLVIMNGLSGSGKTWVAGQLMAALPAIRIRSDIERKRLFKLDETASSDSDVGGGVYTSDVSDEVYSKLNKLAAGLLQAGHNVILDASFLRLARRDSARAVAERTGADLVLLQTTAEDSVLRERIRARSARAVDASEADTSVLDYQLRTAESLTAGEQQRTVSFNSEDADASRLVARIRKVSDEVRSF
jgi:aminoglycoside phosphotransferase family enzyme/predicted kinase